MGGSAVRSDAYDAIRNWPISAPWSSTPALSGLNPLSTKPAAACREG